MTQEVTYKTLDKDLIFNFVLNKLVEQGSPSVDRGVCMYRGNSGRKCALGWLIPDDEYEPSMECNILNVDTGLIGNEEGFAVVVPEENRAFIRSLQVAHDDSKSAENSYPSRSARSAPRWDLKDFEIRLRHVAGTWGISNWMIETAMRTLEEKYAAEDRVKSV